jgi:conjugal transfer ATP-binding protein TraC
LLTAAIEQTYARARSERKVEGKLVQHFAGCRLSDLVRTLVTMEEVGERPASPSEREIARSLALRLQNWSGDTPFGQFVDRPTSINIEAPLVYYETSGLERYPELRGVGLLLLADLIWRRAKRDPARRKIAVFDEAWAMLKIPQAREFIVELYRRARRYHTAVYAVSQSLLDFAEVRGILQNTSSFFLGRLPGEDKAIGELLELPPAALETFRSLSGKRGEYAEFMAWIRREDRLEGDVIRVEASPEEYWLFTTNPLEIERRNKALAEQGSWLAALSVLKEAR